MPVLSEEKKNTKAATINRRFRPYLSASTPAIIAPTRHPSRATLIATARIVLSSVIPKYGS